VLTDLHNAITARLLLDVTGLQSCAAYPDLDHDSKIILPGVLLETAPSIEPAKDEGTEQLCLTVKMRAYCIYDPILDNADLEVRNLAITVAHAVYKASRFGQPVGAAKINFVGEDNFKEELEGYKVWSVEWDHDIRVGTSVWDGDGVLPTELYVSFNNEPHNQVNA